MSAFMVSPIGLKGNRAAVRGLVAGLLCAVAVLFVFAGSAVATPTPGSPFEIEPGTFHITPSTTQAAAHEDLVTSFEFAHNAVSNRTNNDVRTVVVNLPTGFDANNTAVPACTQAQLLAQEGHFRNLPQCPVASQVGKISLDLNVNGTSEKTTWPLYNMEVTSFGVTAELGFKTVNFTQNLIVSVRPGDDGLTVTTPNIIKATEPHDVSVTVWGLPAAHQHDGERGEVCLPAEFTGASEGCVNEFGSSKEADYQVNPFLANPTSCGPHIATMEAYSWEEPGNPSHAETEVGPTTNCERVPFEPSIEVQPTTRSAESPTGLNVSVLIPQSWSNPYSIATANLKETKVTLPEGITINPSAGSGLGACTPAQYRTETSSSLPGEGCPPESKIGSIEIETPVLAEKVDGAVYVATPYDNPFSEPGHPGGSLLALYIVAKNAARGIVVKVAGEVELNPVTGQLVTTFGATPTFEGIPGNEGTPQQPFNRFTLKFRPGATAPLVSPATCGSYAAQAALTSWSAPMEPRLVGSTPFETSLGVHEGPCPSGGVPPFNPQVVSGTQNNAGGSYSPFYLRILREDGEQEITRFSTTLPPGLTGNLSGIPFCPEADIEAAKSVTGAEEETNPSCPAASEIGHTIVSAGVGKILAQTPGKIYLAGPYHGAPLSIVSITSAKVGPFDLGTVVIRFALDINPTTAQVEVSANGSDPIPHIIKGIVVHVREIRVYMNRPQFILNPTNCNPMSISETITGAGTNPADPADQIPVAASAPFQAANCANLQFAPKFMVTTNGKTSKANGAGLTVKLTYPQASQGTQANIRRVKVDLPKQLPSRLTTLQKACTEQEFNTNPATCPVASVIGHAKAITPILPVPLEGPAYFVSHGGAKFPELIMVLQGYGVTIDLHGETFISKAGITSSTFAAVPDQPVTSFELTLPQGPDSALATDLPEKDHYDLCGQKLTMPTEFVGQNGMQLRGQSTPVTVTGCPKTKTLTRAQKLAAALKVCHRKPKAKRASCERAARRAYGPLKRKRKK
jgi:hypothetical protein